MRFPGEQVFPTVGSQPIIEYIIGKKGGSLFPSEDHRGWSGEHHDPLMRESRGRTNIPPEGNVNPLKASTGERSTRGRGKEDNPAQEGGP